MAGEELKASRLSFDHGDEGRDYWFEAITATGFLEGALKIRQVSPKVPDIHVSRRRLRDVVAIATSASSNFSYIRGGDEAPTFERATITFESQDSVEFISELNPSDRPKPMYDTELLTVERLVAAVAAAG